MEEMKRFVTCSKCGRLNTSNAKFCMYCGQNFIEAESLKTQEASVAPSEKEDKKKLVECFNEAADSHKMTDEEKDEKEPSVTALLENNDINAKPQKKLFTIINKVPDKIKKISGNVILAIVAVILFALSFCPIVTIKPNKEILNEFDLDEEELNIGLSGVDFIKFMGATAKNYDSEDFYDSDEAEALELCEEELFDALDEDYNERKDKFELSSSSKKLFAKYIKASYELSLTSENINGSAEEIQVIVIGIFSLFSILISSTILLCSLTSLILCILGKKNKLNIHFAIPAYFGYLLALAFLGQGVIGLGNTAIASDIIGAMVISGLYMVGLMVVGCLKIGKSGWKKIIPSAIAMVLGIIIMSSMFSTFYTADLKTDGESGKKSTNTFSFGSEFILDAICGENEKDSREITYNLSKSEKTDIINRSLSRIGYFTKKEIKNGDADEIAKDVVMMPLILNDENCAAGALSAGYYIMLLIPIFVGLSFSRMVASIYKGKKKSGAIVGIYAAVLIVALIALVINAATVILIESNITYFKLTKSISVGIGAGSIVTLIFTIISIIVNPIMAKIKFFNPTPDNETNTK